MSPAAQNSASAGAAVAGRLRGGIRRAERKITVVTQELVEEERARLIEERQGEVQTFGNMSRCRRHATSAWSLMETL